MVHIYKMMPDFVWGRSSRNESVWRGPMSSEVKKLLLWINQSLLAWDRVNAHLYKNLTICNDVQKAHTPSSRFRPAVLIGDCDLSFLLSVCSVCRLKHVCPCLFRLLVCLFLGTGVTVKTLIITLLPPLLSFREYRFLFPVFQLFYSRSNPSVSIQLLVCPRWSEPTRSNLCALIVVSLHCQVWVFDNINCKTFITDITDDDFMRSRPMFIICVRLETGPNWPVRLLFFFF